MSSRTWLAICAFASMTMQWVLVLTDAPEPKITKWFIAFCVFGAAYLLADHVSPKPDERNEE